MDKASLQKQIIDEINRVSRELNKDHIAEHDFLRNSFITSYQITSAFGSWNRAVKATGLDVYHPHGESIPEEGLLLEIIRLTKELKKCPSESEMRAFGKYSPNPYIRRWGSFSKGREEAYKKYGAPDTESEIDMNESIESKKINHSYEKESFLYKKHHKPKKVQYGEPLDFRGLRHAPINEQGVVYLFGMISKDLGFIIESIRTEYPDCEGKKCIDKKENKWESVLIEFEYKSGQFKIHGHSPDECDLIVCWIHDWNDCPIEVLELSSELKRLK